MSILVSFSSPLSHFLPFSVLGSRSPQLVTLSLSLCFSLYLYVPVCRSSPPLFYFLPRSYRISVALASLLCFYLSILVFICMSMSIDLLMTLSFCLPLTNFICL